MQACTHLSTEPACGSTSFLFGRFHLRTPLLPESASYAFTLLLDCKTKPATLRYRKHVACTEGNTELMHWAWSEREERRRGSLNGAECCTTDLHFANKLKQLLCAWGVRECGRTGGEEEEGDKARTEPSVRLCFKSETYYTVETITCAPEPQILQLWSA